MSRIVIFGPGALGILFSVKLYAAGHRVCVLDYKPERAQRLNKFGLKLIEDQRKISAMPQIFVDPQDVPAADYALILVKAHQTRATLEALRAISSEHTLIISLQNGIGAGDILQEAVPAHNIFLGTTIHGATKKGENVALHAGSGLTVIGPYKPDEKFPEKLKKFQKSLETAGFETEIVQDIYPYLWRKLLVNIGINPLTALTGLRNGGILSFPHILELQRKAVTEAFEIITRSGINLDMDLDSCLELVRRVCEKTGKNTSSMLQDRLNGKETEIDFITGAVLKKAQELGMNAPVNETLTRLIRFHSSAKWHQFTKQVFELSG